MILASTKTSQRMHSTRLEPHVDLRQGIGLEPRDGQISQLLLNLMIMALVFLRPNSIRCLRRDVFGDHHNVEKETGKRKL